MAPFYKEKHFVLLWHQENVTQWAEIAQHFNTQSNKKNQTCFRINFIDTVYIKLNASRNHGEAVHLRMMTCYVISIIIN